MMHTTSNLRNAYIEYTHILTSVNDEILKKQEILRAKNNF
jgi:hypothetical protein